MDEDVEEDIEDYMDFYESDDSLTVEPAPFFKLLPGEICNSIYAYVAEDLDIRFHSSLILVSKQFAQECRFLLWRKQRRCPRLKIMDDILEDFAYWSKQEVSPELGRSLPLTVPIHTTTCFGFLSRYGCLELHFKVSCNLLIDLSVDPPYHLMDVGTQFEDLVKMSASNAYKKELQRASQDGKIDNDIDIAAKVDAELKIRIKWSYVRFDAKLWKIAASMDLSVPSRALSPWDRVRKRYSSKLSILFIRAAFP
jgi:hypothetical protein